MDDPPLSNISGSNVTAGVTPAWVTGPFLIVWVPGTIGVIILLWLRKWVAKRLLWNILLSRLAVEHKARPEKVREPLKNTLLTETVMNTLGLSVAVTFLQWGADLGFEEDEEYFANWYAFISFTACGGYTTAMCINLLALCYFDVMLDKNISKILAVENSFAAMLVIDPVLTFFTATLMLVVTMIMFLLKVYGEAASVGCIICMLGPILKILKTWRVLDLDTIERQGAIDLDQVQKTLNRSKKVSSVSSGKSLLQLGGIASTLRRSSKDANPEQLQEAVELSEPGGKQGLSKKKARRSSQPKIVRSDPSTGPGALLSLTVADTMSATSAAKDELVESRRASMAPAPGDEFTAYEQPRCSRISAAL